MIRQYNHEIGDDENNTGQHCEQVAIASLTLGLMIHDA